MLQLAGISTGKVQNPQAEQIAEKVVYFVIPSEARNLSFFWWSQNREIPRFARNDKMLSISSACKACPT